MLTDISGNWQGKIIYGEAYGNEAGEILYFDMVMEQDGESITATSADTGGYGVNEDPADIEGMFINNEIEFIKKYKTSIQQFRDKGEIVFRKITPGPNIYYTGIYDPKTEIFTGEWTFVKKKSFLSLVINRNERGEGTWSMERKK